MSARTKYDAGKAAGEKLAEMGGKKRICVNQEVGNVALDLRCEGFAEGFGGDVTVLPTTNDPTEIEAKVRPRSNPIRTSIRSWRWAPRPRGEPRSRPSRPSAWRGEVKVATFDCRRVPAGRHRRRCRLRDRPAAVPAGLSAGVFLDTYAKYGLIPGGNVPSGPNLITADKAAQVVDLSAKGIR